MKKNIQSCNYNTVYIRVLHSSISGKLMCAFTIGTGSKTSITIKFVLVSIQALPVYSHAVCLGQHKIFVVAKFECYLHCV